MISTNLGVNCCFPWVRISVDALLETCSTSVCNPAGELIDRVSADGSITERQAAGRAEMVPSRAQAVGAGGEFNLSLSVVMAIAWFRVVRPSQIPEITDLSGEAVCVTCCGPSTICTCLGA